MDLKGILRAAYDADASDIHLVCGQPPVVRVHQVIRPLEEFGPISPEAGLAMFHEMAGPETQAIFQRRRMRTLRTGVMGWPVTA